MIRQMFWTLVFMATGGLRVYGSLPSGPCVIVANHCSHADTAALLAAVPGRRRPAVAAAADYWFTSAWKRHLCRLACAAFPVRRTGGGSGDLASAAELLAAGRDVIVFPEGTRSRGGSPGRFHSGAARLAGSSGVPLVPAGITGTGGLLPVAGRRPRRTMVAVRFGDALDVSDPAEATERARQTVVAICCRDLCH